MNEITLNPPGLAFNKFDEVSLEAPSSVTSKRWLRAGMAGIMLAGGAKKLTARDYVQDGLIAMWDGIENAGFGVHDASSTAWKDLVGGISATCNSVGDDYVNFTNGYAVGSYLNSYFNKGKSFSIEAVFDRDNTTVEYTGPFYIGYQIINLYKSKGNKAFVGDGRGSGTYSANIEGIVQSSYCRNADSRNVSMYMFGLLCKNVDQSTVFDVDTQGYNYTVLGASLQKGSVNVNSVRIYSRALTATEVAANYAVDKERFGLT